MPSSAWLLSLALTRNGRHSKLERVSLCFSQNYGKYIRDDGDALYVPTLRSVASPSLKDKEQVQIEEEPETFLIDDSKYAGKLVEAVQQCKEPFQQLSFSLE
jgi:hypothetical protein